MGYMPKKKKGLGKFGSIATVVSVAFAVIGAVLLIIGFQDSVLWWMKTMGISLMIAALPIAIVVIYHVIDKKIDE